MSHTIPGFKASADINPRRAVKLSGAWKVAQCGDGEQAFGVSAPGTDSAPIPGAATLAAASGNSCRVFCLGEACEVDVGATAVVAGDWVKSDANGKVIPAATNGNYCLGRALQGGAVGATCVVLIQPQRLLVPA